MSSRTCESCLGCGEKPGIGHMPGHKCKKCSGTGKINNFNDMFQIEEKSETPASPAPTHDPLAKISRSEERRLEAQREDAPVRRGRPPKNK